MLKTIIVDDEPLAHDVILHHLGSHKDIAIIQQCYNATKALSFLAKQSVDLLILDINMPSISGIELLKVLANHPQVIIVSAYSEFAIDGFELDVADYLLKPVSAERFTIALDKVRKRLNDKRTAIEADNPYIVLKVDREKRKFYLKDISYLESYGNYVKVWQGSEMTLVSSTLKQIIAELPSSIFLQIHKSYVINRDKVCGYDNEHVFFDNEVKIKIGGTFKKSIGAIL